MNVNKRNIRLILVYNKIVHICILCVNLYKALLIVRYIVVCFWFIFNWFHGFFQIVSFYCKIILPVPLMTYGIVFLEMSILCLFIISCSFMFCFFQCFL